MLHCKIADLSVFIPATGNMPGRCEKYLIQTKENSADIIIRADLYDFKRWPGILDEDDAIYMESGHWF